MFEISEHEIEAGLIVLCFGYRIVKDIIDSYVKWKFMQPPK